MVGGTVSATAAPMPIRMVFRLNATAADPEDGGDELDVFLGAAGGAWRSGTVGVSWDGEGGEDGMGAEPTTARNRALFVGTLRR